MSLQAAFLCKLGADFAAAKPLGTKFERLFAAPLSNSFRAFSGTKPFSTEKLLARIRAVLHNHRQRVKNKNIASGNCQPQDLLIGYEKRRTFVGKNEIALTLAWDTPKIAACPDSGCACCSLKSQYPQIVVSPLFRKRGHFLYNENPTLGVGFKST